MDQELLLKAYDASRKGRSYAFATVVESTKKGTPRKAGAKMIVLEDGSFFGTIGGGRNEKLAITECLTALKTGQPALVTYKFDGQPGNSICGGQIKVFIEPFAGKKHFIICGAGHIALPLSVLGKMLNFKVSIVDNRPEFANKERFPHVDKILVGPHAEKLKEIPINSATYIMVVTQGSEYDFTCLPVALEAPAGYIGVISSKIKRAKFFRRLKEMGVSEAQIQRIHAPAGLDIGAETPEEIAVSIISEMIAKYTDTLRGTLKFDEAFNEVSSETSVEETEVNSSK